MSNAVEARSLSSLTELAANPPAQPREPGQPALDPLVLYIARVPGSRDVFLTPLKPREKVVTAEDVISSLYYLHVEGPEDNDVIDDSPPEHIKHPDGLEPEKTPRTIPEIPSSRENLPAFPQRKTPENQTMQNHHPQPPSNTRRKSVARKPVAPPRLTVRQDTENRQNIDANSATRPHPSAQPSPSRLDHTANTSSRGPENVRPDATHTWTPEGSYRNLEATPPLPPRPPNSLRPFSTSAVQIRSQPPDIRVRPSEFLSPETARERPSYLQRQSTSALPPLKHSAATDRPGPSFVVIRRDPASGEQWNVGRISDPPVFEVSSGSAASGPEDRQSKRAGAPLYVEIANPGYSKYLPTTEGVSTTDTPTGNRVGDSLFRRRMWLESARFPNLGRGHRKTNSNDTMTSSGFSLRSAEVQSGPSSPVISDFGSPLLTGEPLISPSNEFPERRRPGPKGYVFLSPWNGRCEFSSIGPGKSLKCKHSVPSGSAAVSSSPALVSELRFNLPSTHTLRGGSTSAPSSGPGPRRTSRFARPLHRRHGSSAASNRSEEAWDHGDEALTDDTWDRLDLSLGQESAGGGFGGKQAKLGKLIIEDEGLRMLDLVVSANMALWWRAYEKTTGFG